MGKSTTSCFKLISCGDNESVDRDDLQAPEVKDTSDGRKWSFRKRSVIDRALDNLVVSETSSVNKASPDTATASFQTQSNLPIPEKSPEFLRIEDKALVLNPKTKLSETVDATDPNSTTINLNESDVIIIQTAIRGFLAERTLSKQKNIIRLQAAVRGHIVRRHAIGSLRCIQAIVKMQALVRGRHARLLLEESRTTGYEGNLDHRTGKEIHYSTTQVHSNYTSIDKLLRNSFARQLLESKPSGETVNFKCDPLKSDSAWRWLERWMSASSTENDHSLRFESSLDQKNKESLDGSEYQLDDDISPKDNSQLIEAKLIPQDSGVSSEGDENVITYEVFSLESDAHGPSLSSLSGDISKPYSKNAGVESSFSKALNSLADQTTESNFASEVKPDSAKNQSDMEYKKYTDSLKHSHLEEPKTTEKKLLFGSGKASNSSFINAQSKFEELYLATDSEKSVGLASQDTGPKFSSDAVSLVPNFRTVEISPAVSSLPPIYGLEVGGSECGTELSISSTLDSPDRFEAGLSNVEKEAAALDAVDEYKKNHTNRIVDVQALLPIVEKDLSFSDSVLQERHDNSASTDSKLDNVSAKEVISSQADKISEPNENHAQVHVETDVSHQASMYSPEASPRSHVTHPDSQDTPSSQVSVKPKKDSSGKGGHNHKHRAKYSGKNDVSDPYHVSGVRNSSEQLSKNHKTGKQRDSFGAAKTDHGDGEPKDGSSSNSLPSYMQATESARAKAAANSSPRSSPDVLGKDMYVKKRHSLPSSNTKQGSPRVQSSVSQAPQSANANGIHSPQERKWKR